MSVFSLFKQQTHLRFLMYSINEVISLSEAIEVIFRDEGARRCFVYMYVLASMKSARISITNVETMRFICFFCRTREIRQILILHNIETCFNVFSLLFRLPSGLRRHNKFVEKKLQRAQLIHLRLMVAIAAFLLINMQANYILTPRFDESLYTATIPPIVAFNTFCNIINERLYIT